MMPPEDEPTSEGESSATSAMFPTIADREGTSEPPLADAAPADVYDDVATVAATRAYDPSSFHEPAATQAGPSTDALPPSSGLGLSTGGSRRGIVGKIEPGQTLYGKYLVLKRLGGGAMGDVWLVRHVILKAERALKVIVPNFAANEVALMRFQREFEIMASLRHEHAVSIYDANLDDDGGYIEMEYVEGQTIFETLVEARSRPDFDPSSPLMPLEWVDRFLEQLCEVLHVAHEKGIIHRDLKPANMMLVGGRKAGKEYLKVLDFGIAKIRDDPDNVVNKGQESEELKTHGFIGTPSYGSPEQAMSHPNIDGRADLYSVGVMLYEFVAGRLPFKGNHWQVMSQHATAPAPPFVEVNPKLRPMLEVEYAILRTLAKDPAHRPQTARELYEEVHRAIVDHLAENPGAGHATPDPRPYRPEQPPPTEFDGRDTGVPGWSKVAEPTLQAELKPEPEQTLTPGTGRSRRGLIVGASIAVAVLAVVILVKLGIFGRSAGTTPEAVVAESIIKGGPRPKPAIVTGGSEAGGWRDYLPKGYEPVVGYTVADSPWPTKILRKADTVNFDLLPDSSGIYLPEGYQPEKPGDLAGDGWPRAIVRGDDKRKARYLRVVGGKGWTMGSNVDPDPANNETPAHEVLLSGFYMAETEVTNAQFDEFLASMNRIHPSRWFDALEEVKKTNPTNFGVFPAVAIPRKEAETYARYALGLLPTEAQWEYAAKSEGQSRRYVWGNGEPSQKWANIGGQGVAKTAPVGSFPEDKTLQGVLDLGGNVSEWCRDGWQSYKKGLATEVDPCEPVADPEKPDYAIRGANFSSLPDDCPTTHRAHQLDIESEPAPPTLGFRIVIECPDARKPRR